MHDLLSQLKKTFPEITFVAGEFFCWSPASKTVTYVLPASDRTGPWSLFHEIGHAVLDHTTYDSDMELIELEAAAWEKAQNIALAYDVKIDSDYIQDCMDTYRDWLHQRSSCPVCESRSLQQDARQYHCHNCGQVWTVSTSRFCRPYRLKAEQIKRSPPEKAPKATFV